MIEIRATKLNGLYQYEVYYNDTLVEVFTDRHDAMVLANRLELKGFRG